MRRRTRGGAEKGREKRSRKAVEDMNPEEFARLPVNDLTTVELFALVFIAVVAAGYAMRTVDKIWRKADEFLTAFLRNDDTPKRLPPKR